MKWFGVISLMLLLLLPMVLADEVTDAQSRFLSAEAQRLMQTEFDELETNVKNYQDENFRALDAEMRAVMTSAVQKLAIGVVGAMLLAGAGLMYLMIHINKKNQYQGLAEPSQAAHQQQYEQHPVQEMQSEWQYPQQQTFSGQYGQQMAGNASKFNEWQVQTPNPQEGQWNYGGNQ